MILPNSLQELINSLSKLPGIGQKSAQRLAFFLLNRNTEIAEKISSSLNNALNKLVNCSMCNNFSEKEICDICSSSLRDNSLLCIVEMPSDMIMLEQTNSYNGLYFLLMGKISPIDGVGPDEINLDLLNERLKDKAIKEVILATNFTPEGEATSHFISEMISDKGLIVTRMAQGLPIGSEIENSDASSISQALMDRKSMRQN